MNRCRRTFLAAGALIVLRLPSAPAHAELTAHFRAHSIDGGCDVDDEEGITQGDPDRFFRIGIFDDSSVTNTCVDGCTDDGNATTLDVRTVDQCSQNSGCGAWNFTDQTVSKVVPDGDPVYFYFGLFDADTDAEDLLGDHWYYTGLQRDDRTDSNNNNSPYKPDNPINTVCGSDVEKGGHQGNFTVTYSSWFTDSTAPDVSASTPYNVDDSMANVPDNDTTLEFEWTPATDPQTGITDRVFTLEDVTTGTDVFTTQNAPSDGAISFCPTGCDRTFTPQHGHEYRLRIRATNGLYPEITNEQSAWSDWSQPVLVDLADPMATFVSPAAGTWHGADFVVDFDDGDDGAGIDSTSCEWRVTSNAATTLNWTSRSCDDSRTVTVGAGEVCDAQGADVCEVETRNADLARRMSVAGSRSFGIDWTEDSVGPVEARTESGGMIIAETGWTADRDPYFSWPASTSVSPVDGYSWAIDASPDCGSTEVGAAGPFAVQTTIGSLTDGVHVFQIRVVDVAGNCGPVAMRVVQVDGSPDAISNLRAYTDQGGTLITEGVSQPDADPWMEWNEPNSTAPIAGYSWGTGTMTDCSVDIMSTTLQLPMLPNGPTTFWVRAIDEAGNCGPAATFDIVVGGCGDGTVSPTEECDDGNADDTDACVACMDAVCGDGHVWDGNEECDDGDDNSDTEPDACRTDCLEAYCGDGVVDAGEGCDEGDDNADDPMATCRTTCVLATCGDGIVDDGEECDDGDMNSDTEPGACRTMCLLPFCGDGVVDMGEACDDGDMNSDTEPGACRTTCAPATCGDGIVDPDESCDDGDDNSDTEPDACRTNCMPAACGDGVVDSDEQCEPGNDQTDLICLDDCTYSDEPAEDMGGGGADTGVDMGSMNNTTGPDMGSGARPDAGAADTGDDLPDTEPLRESVGGCCGVVSGSSSPMWPVLLALVLGALVRRRQ